MTMPLESSKPLIPLGGRLRLRGPRHVGLIAMRIHRCGNRSTAVERFAFAVLVSLASTPAAAQASPDRAACAASAAAYYTVPVDLVHAVLQTEGGAAGTVSRNTNGSRDLGPMQINSIHLRELASYGITESELIRNECLNIHVGTFLLRRAMDAEPDFWRGVGRYHSATPSLNEAYQKRVWRRLVTLQSED